MMSRLPAFLKSNFLDGLRNNERLSLIGSWCFRSKLHCTVICSKKNYANDLESGADLLEIERFNKRKQPTTRTQPNLSNRAYNFGLSGIGKITQTKFKNNAIRVTKVQGDVLFGLFPVLLALEAQRRSFKRLFMKDSLYAAHQLDAKDSESVDQSSQSPEGELYCEQLAGECDDSSLHVIKSIITQCRHKNIEIIPCSRDVLDQLSSARPHQGVCMEATRLLYDESFDINQTPELSQPSASKRHHLWVILDGIRDPMNFGAILRCAYYMQVDRLFSPKLNSCPLTPVVSKASAGAMELMSVHRLEDISSLLKVLLEQGWHILGTACHQQVTEASAPVLPLTEVKLTSPTVLVIGSENKGISSDVRHLCQSFVTVMPGGKIHPAVDSLNVGVATGIILHHLSSQLRSGVE